MKRIKLPPTLKCKQCEYEWVPRNAIVRICPKCKRTTWDVEKRQKAKA